MALLDTSRGLTDGVRFGARASGLIETLLGTVVSWNDRRATRKALSALSARELDDIGLSRSDIQNF